MWRKNNKQGVGKPTVIPPYKERRLPPSLFYFGFQLFQVKNVGKPTVSPTTPSLFYFGFQLFQVKNVVKPTVKPVGRLHP